MFLRATIATFCLLVSAAHAQDFSRSLSRGDPAVAEALARFDTALEVNDASTAGATLAEALRRVLNSSNSGLSVRDQNGLAYTLTQDFLALEQVGDGGFAINVDWFAAADVRMPADEASCILLLAQAGDRVTSRSFGRSVWTGTPPTTTCEIKTDGYSASWIAQSFQPHGGGVLVVRMAFVSSDFTVRDRAAEQLAGMPQHIYSAVGTPRR